MTSATPETNHPSSPDSFVVATWNTCLDNTKTNKGLMKSQSERLPSQIATLEALRDRLGGELDAVAIQEAHKTDLQHNGERLARALGYGAGQWVEHNQKPKSHPTSKTGRKGEYVGWFGARIGHAESIELGDNRRAIVTHFGGVALANIHTRADRTGELQPQQVGVVLEYLAEYPLALFVGDFNTRLGGLARKAIEDEGFESAFTLAGKRPPRTWPTRGYRKIMLGPKARYLMPSVMLDDIYVRGLEVEWAIPFVGDSDHKGLAAKVSVPRY